MITRRPWRRCQLPAGLDGYVFKAKSPSCGIHGIPHYAPGGQPSDHRGRGVFAEPVMARFPLLPAEDEGRLNDAVLREEFTERVFAFAWLRELLSSPWEPRDLVARIESYRHGADPLSVPVAILAHYASDGELPWLAGQSYLEPFPAALRLRHSVPR
jgi:hypothetical protein